MRQFEFELDGLNQKLLQMGGKVETAIHRSIRSLADGERRLAIQVIQDQPQIGRMEMEIDGLATRLLALWQPVARDLRLLTVALKINADLNRMGELAADVSKRALTLLDHPLARVPFQIPEMASIVQSMLLRCLQAFLSGDSGMAHSVLESDREVDELRDAVHMELQRQMQATPEVIPAAVDLIFIARNLERIGDHATNIAEDVIYLVKGAGIRRNSPVS